MKTISLVIPCFDEAAGLDALFARLDETLRSCPGHAFEIVCVNDGSRDGTLDKLLAVASARADTVVVDLSRNFGKEAALSAGLWVAAGDAVIPMDADLQNDPADIGRLTVPISAIAEIVAMHGGSTFQTNMFSTVNTAFDVAVMRLVSIPGRRSEK